jgi:predicted acylesterase/phospholipase RssA
VTDTGPDELRLALVLNGGVSLAIWISGVVAEIDALRRCDDPAMQTIEGDGDSSLPIYRALAAALGVRVRVDVIAGTSAGGLNGGLLGTAIAAGVPYSEVKKLWMDLGDLEGLFNYGPPQPISLLKGEAVLFAQLKQRFTPLLVSAKDDDGDAEEDGRRVRVILTGTDVAGVCRDTQDSFGGVLTITDHRLHARFAHGGDAGQSEVPSGWAEVLPKDDPEGRRGMADAVARAARTSASFPIGFEPSELVLSLASADDNTALGAALFTRDGHNVASVMRGEQRGAPLRRWAIDGGILDNSPIGAVLDTVTGLSANRPVQRAVVFVVPYTDDPAKASEPEPGFAEILGTVLNMPRDVAFTDHLEEVERDLARRAGDRTTYDQLLGLPPAVLRQLANSLYRDFWRLRAVTSVWSLVQGHRSHLSDPPQAGVALPGPIVAKDLVDLAKKTHVRWLPEEGADPDDLWAQSVDASSEWRWGGAPAERVALRIADWLMGAREVLAVEPGVEALRAELIACQTSVHTALAAYRSVERERQAAESDDAKRAGTVTQETLVALSSDTWTPERQNAARTLLMTVAKELVRAQGRPDLTDEARSMLGIEKGAQPGSENDVAQRLLMADVAWRGMRGELDDEHQSSNSYEFLRLNAAAPPPFGSRKAGEPANKLFGMQLGHFAGFVRSSWRANDFMWGRLDGAARLVDLLLAPRRLKLSPVRYDTLAAIPGLRRPLPAKRGDFIDPEKPDEIEDWRSCFQDTLALAIIDAELDSIAAAMTLDTDTRQFAPDPVLSATLAPGDTKTRFVGYAGALCARGAAPQRTVKERVMAERDTPAGEKLEQHAVKVVGTVLKGQGGPLEVVGKGLLLVGEQRIEKAVEIQMKVKGFLKSLRARFGGARR